MTALNDIRKGILINGLEITNLEYIKITEKEIKALTKIIKYSDYREGARAFDARNIELKRLKSAKLECKISDLECKQNAVRNLNDYNKLDKQISKLKNELFSLNK